MNEIANLTPVIDLLVIGIGGAVITFLVRIEHRLTKIETKIGV